MRAADGDSRCRDMHVLGCALQVGKQLADCVIPNEYGIDPGSKIRIGSKICCALLGKLLADLSNMQEESIATAVRCVALCSLAGHALLSGVNRAASPATRYRTTSTLHACPGTQTPHKQQGSAMLVESSMALVD